MNTYTKWIIGLVVLVVIAGAFFFLTPNDGPSLGEPVKIGAILFLTGNQAQIHPRSG